MTPARERGANQLLSVLPEVDQQRWWPLLEEVEGPLGLVLYESGSTLHAGATPSRTSSTGRAR